MDALPAQQGRCDFLVRCTSERAVERLEDKVQAAAGRVGRKQAVGKLSSRVKSIEAFERIQLLPHPIGEPDRVDGKAERGAKRRAFQDELETRMSISQHDVLPTVSRESHSNWRALVAGLKQRGLAGVEFVVSDGHPGSGQRSGKSCARQSGSAVTGTAAAASQSHEVDEHAGAAQPGDQAAYPGRRHLPQPAELSAAGSGTGGGDPRELDLARGTSRIMQSGSENGYRKPTDQKRGASLDTPYISSLKARCGAIIRCAAPVPA